MRQKQSFYRGLRAEFERIRVNIEPGPIRCSRRAGKPVLIDLLMPGRSGLDLLVNLRSDSRWRDIPLVVITGSDKILEDDCQSYLGSHHGVRGPDGVLGKPVDRKTLLAVLRHLPDSSEGSCPG